MKANKKIISGTKSENALTIKKRIKYLPLLSDEQIQFLNSLGRYRLLEIFEGSNYLKGNSWEFVDYKVSKNYLDKSISEKERLYCNCGREVKYQYIVKSKTTSERLKFGITHFMEHFSLPKKAAKEIYQQVNLINLRIDEILVKKMNGEKFSNKLYEEFKECVNTTGEGQILFERVTRFKELELPLLSADEEEIKRRLRRNRIREITEQHKRTSPTRNSNSTKKAALKEDVLKKELKVEHDYSVSYGRKQDSRRLSKKYSQADEKLAVARARELIKLDSSTMVALSNTLEDALFNLKVSFLPENDFRKLPGTKLVHRIVSLELALKKFDGFLYNSYSRKEKEKFKMIYLNQVSKNPEKFRRPTPEEKKNLLIEKERLLTAAFHKLGIAVEEHPEMSLSERVQRLDNRMRSVNHKRWKGYKRYTDIKGEIQYLTDQLNFLKES